MLDWAKVTLNKRSRPCEPTSAGTGSSELSRCVSVFRDEMTNLLGNNVQAQKLKSQTFCSANPINKADHRPPRQAQGHRPPPHKSVLT
jgi:hypothetical protein